MKTNGAIKKVSESASENLESVPTLCYVHRYITPMRLGPNCVPGECSVMTNYAEASAALRAVESLAGDLEEALMEDLSLPLNPPNTYAGTPLGSVMAIRGLAVRVLSELRNPAALPEDLPAPVAGGQGPRS